MVSSFSVAKHLESANSMFSFIWWMVGFYWVTADGQNLTSDSPLIYWFVGLSFPFKVVSSNYVFLWPFLITYNAYLLCRLCITFLAIDVVIVMLCLIAACIVGIAVCCCLPCIIAILYVITDQVD